MTTHMMIDNETIATTGNAIIIQAGRAIFDPENGDIKGGYEYNVSAVSCLRLGGALSDDTLRWWLMEAPAEARLSVARPGVDIQVVLQQLALTYKQHGCSGVWSHGLSFDVAQFSHYYSMVGAETPWNFRAPRDTRTLFEMAEDRGWKFPERAPTAHTGLEDAKAQVGWVVDALRYLRRCKHTELRVVEPEPPQISA